MAASFPIEPDHNVSQYLEKLKPATSCFLNFRFCCTLHNTANELRFRFIVLH